MQKNEGIDVRGFGIGQQGRSDDPGAKFVFSMNINQCHNKLKMCTIAASIRRCEQGSGLYLTDLQIYSQNWAGSIPA